MYAKYEVSISYGSKVITKVKVDNRQTDMTKNYASTIRSGAWKTKQTRTATFLTSATWWIHYKTIVFLFRHWVVKSVNIPPKVLGKVQQLTPFTVPADAACFLAVPQNRGSRPVTVGAIICFIICQLCFDEWSRRPCPIFREASRGNPEMFMVRPNLYLM